MLQKTLLNIEGLGRELDPDLDLWRTAKPYLERWMNEQIGWRGLVRNLRREAPYWASALPEIPRLVHRALAEDHTAALRAVLERIAAENARRNRILGGLLVVAALALALLAFFLLKNGL
jgi:ubiquinone biosynthesis protein